MLHVLYIQGFIEDQYVLSSVVDVNRVAAMIIGMFVMGSYMLEKGATSHDLSV